MRHALAAALLVFLLVSSLSDTKTANHDLIPSKFTKLRMAYGARDDYYDLCEKERPSREISAALDDQDFDSALAISEQWLKQCPIDVDVQYLRAITLKRLERYKEASHHYYWHYGLLQSIFSSGDGKTTQTAYEVISIGEEYVILRELRVRLVEQALTADLRDSMTVEDEHGSEFTIYFYPELHFDRMKRRQEKILEND